MAVNIAIITMVYNESRNLPIWVRHYHRTAPNATLFVIDHGSDDGCTENLDSVTKIPLPRDSFDERDRTFLVNSLQQGLLRYYETVIYADCDELIFPDPTNSATLEEHLARKRYAYASPIGVNVTHIVDLEPPIDFSRPLLQQRRYGQFHSHMCKPVVTRVPLIWEAGFHSCNQRYYIDRDLYLFHIKQIDRDEALSRQQIARHVPWSKGALEANHSAHHRYDDDRFLREFFLDPANELRQGGAQKFAFEQEIGRLQQQARELSGAFQVPGFKGPIVEIPERFRTVF